MDAILNGTAEHMVHTIDYYQISKEAKYRLFLGWTEPQLIPRGAYLRTSGFLSVAKTIVSLRQ
jgi:hypothetical protein